MTSKNLYIIDGHAHIYAAYYAPMRPLNSPSGEPTKATYIFTTAVMGLIQRKRPDMLVVAMDGAGPTFRSEISPDYKAHRPPMPDELPAQIARIEEIMEAMRIPVIRAEGFEADDVIGTLAAQASRAGIRTYICSKDKDMLQLISEHTVTYDMQNDVVTDFAAMQENMRVTPRQFIDVLALQGDTADNVPGVKDVGPKTALQWIQKYGSLEELFAHADEITGKRGDNLRASKEQTFLSRQLVTIRCDAPVELDQKAFALHEPDKERLAALFTELGFTRLLAQIGKAETAAPAAAAKEEIPLATIHTIEKDYHLVDTAEAFEAFVAELGKQTQFAIDTETTGLEAMRADLVGISFAWKPFEAYYLPVKGPLGQKRLDVSLVRQRLGPILADASIRKIGQNIKYDMIILAKAGMPLAGVTFDTMVASYVLDAARPSHSMEAMARDFLGYQPIPIAALIGKGKNQLSFDMVDTRAAADYSAEDADVTLRLYEYLAPRLAAQPLLKKLFDEVEMPLAAVLARMEMNGVSLDAGVLKGMSHAITAEIEQLRAQIHSLAGVEFNIDSTKQLADVLFDRLGLKSTRMGKTIRSTDAAVLEQLVDEHEIVPLILQYRQLVKLKNTYVDKLGQLINPRTGRVHASFNQTVTATGRLSSSEPNLQNIPVRTELGRKIRSAFVPAEADGCIVSADYSQIELRLLAHFSGDAALRQAFAEDRDIHAFVASQVFGVPPEEVTREMRSRAKAVNFGIIYGQSAFGLARAVGISQNEAKRFIDGYFERYGSIREFMDRSIERAKKTGYAETILHRRRSITGLTSKNFNKRALAERLTINTIVQGSAADLIKVAMINIQRKIDTENLPVKMILQIHDELVFEMPAAEAERHAVWIAEAMTGAIALDVPLKVDVSIGPNWLSDK
ncbi:MAG TPA: DNA polymerase I [Anaerohalosphaeraceae bacterium]|nr:DNA polymerase I [Anaerohalosphaeraceae bacterium]HRT49527.1 DNA polymerase I [Anaerohalosphaeraceae bacterium]HRT85311.1 DNA polymerase I [Anaerohalosphaeraceae bacterium]